MTARKWGNAVEGNDATPADEIKALRELLVSKGVLTESDVEKKAKPKEKAR